MTSHSTAPERVAFGLDLITDDRMVSVRLRDLLFVRQVLAEFVRFFHQPSHYQTFGDVQRFLLSDGEGAIEVVREALYRRIEDMLPKDVKDMFAAGQFDHPLPPAYHEESA